MSNALISDLLWFQSWMSPRAKLQCRSAPTRAASLRRVSTVALARSSTSTPARWRNENVFPGGTWTFSNRTWCSWCVSISASHVAATTNLRQSWCASATIGPTWARTRCATGSQASWRKGSRCSCLAIRRCREHSLACTWRVPQDPRNCQSVKPLSTRIR